MSLIIPYDDDIGRGDGAFIKPNTEIIPTLGSHEKFALNYCRGSEFENLMARYNSGETIDIFESSKLTKEQLQLFKMWVENEAFSHQKAYSDFLVYMLRFDKVEAVMRKTITTISETPHTRFYNYYLMDWHIVKKTPMKYDKEKGLFLYDEPENWIIRFNQDREVAAEIEEIKQKVLKKDRPHFFR